MYIFAIKILHSQWNTISTCWPTESSEKKNPQSVMDGRSPKKWSRKVQFIPKYEEWAKKGKFPKDKELTKNGFVNLQNKDKTKNDSQEMSLGRKKRGADKKMLNPQERSDQTLCAGRDPAGGAISNSRALISSSTWPSDLIHNQFMTNNANVTKNRGKQEIRLFF